MPNELNYWKLGTIMKRSINFDGNVEGETESNTSYDSQLNIVNSGVPCTVSVSRLQVNYGTKLNTLIGNGDVESRKETENWKRHVRTNENAHSLEWNAEFFETKCVDEDHDRR